MQSHDIGEPIDLSQKNNLQSINLLDIVTWLEGSNLIFWLEQQRFTMLR